MMNIQEYICFNIIGKRTNIINMAKEGKSIINNIDEENYKEYIDKLQDNQYFSDYWKLHGYLRDVTSIVLCDVFPVENDLDMEELYCYQSVENREIYMYAVYPCSQLCSTSLVEGILNNFTFEDVAKYSYKQFINSELYKDIMNYAPHILP